MEGEYFGYRRSTGSSGGDILDLDDDPMSIFENSFEIGNYDRSSIELKRSSLEKPNTLITPDMFELDLSSLERILRDGYIRKEKNQHDSSSNVQYFTIRVRCKEVTLVPSKLRLSMVYSRKSPHLTWTRDFEVRSEGGSFKCNIRLDPGEMYSMIFQSLSRNTHLSDEDRKVRIQFQIIFFDSSLLRKSYMIIRLNQASRPFFVCGWRKAVEIRKRMKKMQNTENVTSRIMKQCNLVLLHPPSGTVSQPVSIYLRCNDMSLLKLFESQGQNSRKSSKGDTPRLSVYFGPNMGQICSAMIETMHPRYKGLFRVVCLTPPNPQCGPVVVRAGISRKNVSKNAFAPFNGQVRFNYMPVFHSMNTNMFRGQPQPQQQLKRNVNNNSFPRNNAPPMIRRLPPPPQQQVQVRMMKNSNIYQQKTTSFIPPPPTGMVAGGGRGVPRNFNQFQARGFPYTPTNNLMMNTSGSRISTGSGIMRRPTLPPTGVQRGNMMNQK